MKTGLIRRTFWAKVRETIEAYAAKRAADKFPELSAKPEKVKERAEKFLTLIAGIVEDDDLPKLQIPEDDEAAREERRKHIAITPFKDAYHGQDRDYGGQTIIDVLAQIAEINSLLPWRFVLFECLKYGIGSVGTEGGGFAGNWHPGQWSRMGFAVCGFGYYLDLNPHLDREQVSKEIKDRYNCDVPPSDIYYWIWFREIGNRVTREFRLSHTDLERLQGYRSEEAVQRVRRIAEEKAIDFACKRFYQWKREQKRCSSRKPQRKPSSTRAS